MDIVSQGSVAVILLLRTCALWNHNIYIIISLGVPVLGIGAIGFCRGGLRRWKELRPRTLYIAPVRQSIFYCNCCAAQHISLQKELIGVGNYIARSISVNILSRFLLDIQEAVQAKYSQYPPTLVSSRPSGIPNMATNIGDVDVRG
ncbi:hypothetical protein BU17DRAFT_64001 [Hysterangium stoloniferum]|nr:hypothetical protein BU17DRAFT_64001 [Hysterangium stoloniferum]